MKETVKNFYRLMFASIIALGFATVDTYAASKGTARINNRTGARASTTTVQKAETTIDVDEAKPEIESLTESEPEPEPVIIVDNKTSQFDDIMADIGAGATDKSSSDMAERIRRQRALLDDKGNQTTNTTSGMTGANKCDQDLRKCMAEKCGNEFTKCSGDSTTVWSEKIDSCRRKTTCSGHEYALLAPEILADRDMNVRLSYYESVLTCGNRYNSCIFAECGATLDKCLSKSDGDKAISKCETVAKECKEQDSGLAGRAMGVFGDLRGIATNQAKKDEERLYELRKLMQTQCNRLGAMFDERTLDCVYTVNFFAGDDATTPKASKKLYAGDSFQCNANWFGIDVTTFKENAYRLTRAQTSASSAMLGAGVGTAAGLVTSGAIDRALQTQKAKKAADKEAKKEGTDCKDTLADRTHVKSAKYDAEGNCNVSCKKGYERTDQNTCVPNAETMRKEECEELRRNIKASHHVDIAETALKVGSDTLNVAVSAVAAYFNPEAGMAAANATGQVAAGSKYSKEEAAKIIEGCQKYYEGAAAAQPPQSKEGAEPKPEPRKPNKIDITDGQERSELEVINASLDGVLGNRVTVGGQTYDKDEIVNGISSHLSKGKR